MRLQPETALVVCLCLWIPVAQSYGGFDLEDGSGDDEEFSGSGSGDNDMWTTDLNTTRAPQFTVTPVNLPEEFTKTAHPDRALEPSAHLTESPLPYTTQTTENQPTEFINKSFGSVEDQNGEPTTVSTVAQPETTVPPAVKIPVVPTQEDKYTPAAKDKEDSTKSSIIDKEEDKGTVVKAVSVTTEAPDMQTTPQLQSTKSAGNLADTEASGDSVVSSTVPGIVKDDFEANIIPGDTVPNMGKPRMNDNDFDFENEIQKTETNPEQSGSGSDFARGSASDNDSLLERKEVLAGVIAGGVVGLAFAIMLVSLMVYRMKKKDEGSYSLDEHKHPNGGYQKPQKQEEFLA